MCYEKLVSGKSRFINCLPQYTVMSTLSVVIAVKNEADKIQTCLEHATWADEIIIVDNNSTDNTVEICKKYTANIFHCDGGPHNYIPYIQNFGIKKATKEWVLVLDADVIVPEKAKNEILTKIQKSDCVGYYLPHQMVAFGKVLNYALFCNILKLFRRGAGEFDCSSAHCTLNIKGKIGTLHQNLLHYAHPDINTFVRKMNLYTTQDAKKIIEDGKGGLLNKDLKTVKAYALCIEPLAYAGYLYFIKKYYKDGLYGSIFSILMGFYLFLERAKVIELRNRKHE